MNGANLQLLSKPIDGKPWRPFHLVESIRRQTYMLPGVLATCLPTHQGLSQKLPYGVSACSIMHQGQNMKKHIAIRAMHSPDDFESSDDKDIDKELMREFSWYSNYTNGKNLVALDGGTGSTLLDVDGKVYLDFTCNRPFGHNDLETLSSTMDALRTVINDKYLKEEVSKQLIARSFADQVFYTNSQTEAIELSFAIARVYQQCLHPLHSGEVYSTVEFIAFIDAFHGRTMDSISPLDHLGKHFAHRVPPGFTFLNHGDIVTALKLIKEERFAAVFVEPFQGKDGTNLATKEFLHALRVACNNVGCLLVFDETQCGFGWTGNIWAHQTYGIFPDMMVVGDSLADGQPFGAVLVNDRVGRFITRAELVISQVSLAAVLDMVNKFSKPLFSSRVKKKAENFKILLINKLGGNSHVKEIRSNGLAIGIEFDVSALPLVEACRKSGLFISTVGTPNAIMLRPPLIISKVEMKMGAEILLQSMPVLDEDI